jgi:Flp pilus assembly protein TadG
MVKTAKSKEFANSFRSDKPLKGQAAVEFALILVFLMAILLGVLEVSRLMFINAEINNAAREGARYASITPGITDATLRTYVRSKLALANPAQVSVTGPTYPGGVRCVFCPVSVDVQYRWESFVAIPNLGPIDLSATATKLVEN